MPVCASERYGVAAVRAIAAHQRGIITCILGYLVAVAAAAALPRSGAVVEVVAVVAVGVVSMACVVLLSARVYGAAAGVALGVLALVPVVGLVVLLVVNGAATRVLRSHGVRVGFLGARRSDLG